MIRVRFVAAALAAAQRRRSMCTPRHERKQEPEYVRPVENDEDEGDDRDDRHLA